MSEKESAEKKIRNIRRQNRKKYSAEEKIRVVIEGLRGDESIAELCRREGITQSMYYKVALIGLKPTMELHEKHCLPRLRTRTAFVKKTL